MWPTGNIVKVEDQNYAKLEGLNSKFQYSRRTI